MARSRRRIDPQAARKAMAKDATSSKYLDLPAGTTRIRILPRWVDDGDPRWYRKMVLHHKFKIDGVGRAPHCLEYEEGKTCPICLACNQPGAPEGSEGRTRYMANVLVTGEAGDTSKKNPVQIMSFGPMIFKKIQALMDKPGYGDITDEEDGWDLFIEKEGSGFNTEYDVTPVPNGQGPIPFGKWESCLHDLEKEVTCKYLPWDQLIQACQVRFGPAIMQVVLNQLSGTRPSASTRRPSKPVPKPAVQDEEEEEVDHEDEEEEGVEEPEDEEETEEEEEEPVVRKKRAKKKRVGKVTASEYEPPLSEKGDPLTWSPEENAWLDEKTLELYDEGHDGPEYAPPPGAWLKDEESMPVSARDWLAQAHSPPPKESKKETKKKSKKKRKRTRGR